MTYKQATQVLTASGLTWRSKWLSILTALSSELEELYPDWTFDQVDQGADQMAERWAL